jgi:hypothetical protein
VTKASRGSLAIHSSTGPVQQERAGDPVAGCAVDGASHRGWQRDEHDLVAFAADPKDTVAVFFAEVGDVGASSFEYA